jgi:hypothetical protein
MFDESSREPLVPSVVEDGRSPASPAEARFTSCRWQEPPVNGTAAHCTHREVLPFAGTGGFSPEAWCLDCGHYKLRRRRRR